MKSKVIYIAGPYSQMLKNMAKNYKSQLDAMGQNNLILMFNENDQKSFSKEEFKKDLSEVIDQCKEEGCENFVVYLDTHGAVDPANKKSHSSLFFENERRLSDTFNLQRFIVELFSKKGIDRSLIIHYACHLSLETTNSFSPRNQAAKFGNYLALPQGDELRKTTLDNSCGIILLGSRGTNYSYQSHKGLRTVVNLCESLSEAAINSLTFDLAAEIASKQPTTVTINFDGVTTKIKPSFDALPEVMILKNTTLGQSLPTPGIAKNEEQKKSNLDLWDDLNKNKWLSLSDLSSEDEKTNFDIDQKALTHAETICQALEEKNKQLSDDERDFYKGMYLLYLCETKNKSNLIKFFSEIGGDELNHFSCFVPFPHSESPGNEQKSVGDLFRENFKEKDIKEIFGILFGIEGETSSRAISNLNRLLGEDVLREKIEDDKPYLRTEEGNHLKSPSITPIPSDGQNLAHQEEKKGRF